MSIIKTLTLGLIYKEGESPGSKFHGTWIKYGNYWLHIKVVLLPTYFTLLPIYLLAALGSRRAKIAIGKRLGYSGCDQCGMTWNYVKGKSIYFSSHEAMFPLCEDCFEKLSTEEIDPSIERIVKYWVEESKRCGIEWERDQTPEQVIKAAQAAVRRMKDIAAVQSA